MSRSARLAFVTTLCNRNDYMGHTGDTQVQRAINLRRSLTFTGSNVHTVALLHGFPPDAFRKMRNSGWAEVHNTTAHRLPFRAIVHPEKGYHWGSPRANLGVQLRTDGACTVHKLFAWNLTQFDRVMVSDTDVCMLEDPVPWMRKNGDRYFVASSNSRWARGYEGFLSALMFLQPSRLVGKILMDSARTGSFIPYTNTEQDVIETVFATHLDYPTLPKWAHSKAQEACQDNNYTNNIRRDGEKSVKRAPLSWNMG